MMKTKLSRIWLKCDLPFDVTRRFAVTWRKAARGRGAWQALKACHCQRPREPILQSNDDQRGSARQLVWHQGLGDAL